MFYHARVRLSLASWVLLGPVLLAVFAIGQVAPAWEKTQTVASEPEYDDTFSGSVVQLAAANVTVSRSILGKPAEKRTFSIKSDTRVEGKLRMNAKVTIGFVTSDDGDVARLIVVRTIQKTAPNNKK